MAQEVIVNLRALQVKQGCTFVVTIHQPAPAVFDAFNRLVLLNYGRIAYFGRVVTPGCQIGYMDYTGCHQLNVFWLSLPGVRLVTWTKILAATIEPCFDCKITW
jgi:ABC-type multidrug transport system ATPase subunit